MNFKQWLETGDLNGYGGSYGDDPDTRGLTRSSIYRKPKLKKTKKSKKIAKSFGIKESVEGASIAFTDGKSLLIGKRATGDGIGKWDLPGGHAMKDEIPIETAEREAKEECGSVKGKRVEKISEPKWATYIYKVNKPFKCTTDAEHSDWQWVEFEDLKKYDLQPCVKKLLDKITRA